MTGFSDEEEAMVGLTEKVPFLLESELKKQGGHYTCGGAWTSHVVVDGNLVTGQNPQSSEECATAALKLIS